MRSVDRPATFRDVFASREYRFLFSANVLSWVGDYMARAAVMALVFRHTGSVALSAATFALSYLPWIAGGPVLAAWAERRSFRPVMVASDLIRMVLIALVALPGMPVWAMLSLLFVSAMANPPFQAARSALLPQLLTGDRFVVGLSLQQSAGQVAQVVGLASGGMLAAFNPRLALLANAVTFGLSALLVRMGVGDRKPIGVPEQRRHILRETADGFRVIGQSPVMRAIALLVFATMFFGIVPEGLAAAWAASLAKTKVQAGAMQGLIMVANPLGFVVGSLVIGRFIPPGPRRLLIPWFALFTPLALVPALSNPSVAVIAGMAAVSGFATAGLIPASNGIFVQVLPPGYRARAFGVMQSGVQLAQGFGVLATGALADRFALHLVVGVWSIGGVGLVLLMVLQWPSRTVIDAAIEANRPAIEANRPASNADAAADAASRPSSAALDGQPAAGVPVQQSAKAAAHADAAAASP